jgi:hypothetical protein
MALALVLTYEQSVACSILTIVDVTGQYNPISNPTGWEVDGPTPEAGMTIIDDGSIITATLVVTLPSGTVVLLDLMDVPTWRLLTPYTTGDPFDAGTSPSNLSYALTEAVLGEPIIDGIYSGVLTVTDTNATTAANFNIAIFCNVECCVDNLIALMPSHYTCDNCDNQYALDVITMKAMVEALKLAADSASITEFNNILLTLKNACIAYGQCNNC